MKSLWRIAKPVPASLPFKHNDLYHIIFSPDVPTLEVRPFESLYPSTLALVPVLYRLDIVEDPSISIANLMKRAVLRVGKYDVHNPELLLRLPGMIFNLLANRYFEVELLWNRYVMQEMEEFCQLEESKLQWTLCQQMGIDKILPMPLRFEQKTWILMSERIGKNAERKFVVDVRDSLLPWLNLELYRNYEKSKEKRTNVSYEKQHQSMVDSTFASEELDIIQ